MQEPHRYRITFALAPGRRDLLLDDLGVLAQGLQECARLYLVAHPDAPADARPVEEPYGYRPAGQDEWVDVACSLNPPARGPYEGQRVVDPMGHAARVAVEIGGELAVHTRGDSYKPIVRLPDGRAIDPFPDGGWRPLRPGRHRVTFVTGLFDGDADRDLSHACLDVLLETLTRVDEIYLRAFPKTPQILESGLLYMEEPPGQEDWQDVPTCLKMKLADCLPLSTLVLRDDYTFAPISELRIGDRIMGDGVFTTVLATAMTGTKTILEFGLENGCVLRCSPTHRLFDAEDREVRAEDVKVGTDLRCPTRPFPTIGAFPGDGRLGERDLAWLVGTYVADGWHSKDAKRFSISGFDDRPKRRKLEQKERVKAMCARVSVYASWQRKCVTVVDRVLTELMSSCGSHAPIKRLPTMRWSLEQVRSIIEGLLTDASTATSGTLTHGTTSPTLALQIRVLYRMLGQSVHIRSWSQEEHRGLGKHPMYRIGVRRLADTLAQVKSVQSKARRTQSATRVRSIRQAAPEPCYDITTDTGKFYLPESDLIVHNCEDLACWLAAYLRTQGTPARARYSQHVIRHPGGRTQHLYHITTETADGRRLDPSRWTGMG